MALPTAEPPTVNATTLRRVRWAVALALALGLGAMLRYPGGTPLDPTTRRYSLSQNFLSDLGMTVAYDGRANRLGALLFVLSLLALIAGLGASLFGLLRGLLETPASRRWAQAGGAMAVLTCVAFAGVAVTPENRVMGIHVAFTLWAWRLIAVSSLLVTIACAHSDVFPRRVTLVLGVLTTMLSAYVAMLTWGPSVASTDGLMIQVIAQKIITATTVALLTYLSVESDRVGLPR